MQQETERKYKLIIDDWLTNKNATAAYMKQYPNASIETARVNAHRVVHDERMQEYIDIRKAEIRQELEDKHGVTRYTMIEDQLKKKRALDKVFELSEKEVLTSKEEDLLKRMSAIIRTSDVNKADEILIKMLGLYESEKIDITTDGESVKQVFVIGGKEVEF